MRKIFYLLSVTFLLFQSCSTEDSREDYGSVSTGNNNTGKNVDYEFTITINGEVHKVKGNTAAGVPTDQAFGNPFNYFNYLNNYCYADSALLQLGIKDVAQSNYVLGQNMGCMMQFGNLLLGTNQATVSFTGEYFKGLASSLGSIGSFPIQELPINITDLGTNTITSGTPQFHFDFGNTLKGNYSGTIYLPRSITTSPYTVYDIPVQLSLDFKAVRIY